MRRYPRHRFHTVDSQRFCCMSLPRFQSASLSFSMSRLRKLRSMSQNSSSPSSPGLTAGYPVEQSGTRGPDENAAIDSRLRNHGQDGRACRSRLSSNSSIDEYLFAIPQPWAWFKKSVFCVTRKSVIDPRSDDRNGSAEERTRCGECRSTLTPGEVEAGRIRAA